MPNDDKPVRRAQLDEIVRILNERKIPLVQVSIYLDLLRVKDDYEEVKADDPDAPTTFRAYLADEHQLILEDGEECTSRMDIEYNALEKFAKAWKL